MQLGSGLLVELAETASTLIGCFEPGRYLKHVSDVFETSAVAKIKQESSMQ